MVLNASRQDFEKSRPFNVVRFRRTQVAENMWWKLRNNDFQEQLRTRDQEHKFQIRMKRHFYSQHWRGAATQLRFIKLVMTGVLGAPWCLDTAYRGGSMDRIADSTQAGNASIRYFKHRTIRRRPAPRECRPDNSEVPDPNWWQKLSITTPRWHRWKIILLPIGTYANGS